MIDIIKGSLMKEVDNCTINQIGIPSVVLMERAALAVFSEAEKYISLNDRILCLCGTGNNGADGLAVSRMLVQKGYNPRVIVIGNRDKATGEFYIQEGILKNLNTDISYINSDNIGSMSDIFTSADCIIDGIFGIGLSREVTGVYKSVIELINTVKMENGCRILSIDIPSGLNADTGVICGAGVNADITVTFGKAKAGHFLGMGKDYTGKLIVTDVGFPEKAYKNKMYFSYEKSDLSKLFFRKNHTNKGTYGKILIVAGNENMCGAAYFASKAACLSGAGLVYVYTHKNNKNVLNTMVPEAIVFDYDRDLKEIAEIADVIIAGPGIGVSELSKQHLKICLESEKPIVVDADGLNIIAENQELERLLHENVIITPHLKEMERLCKIPLKKIADDLAGTAAEYGTKHGITVVLKDCSTVIFGVACFNHKCNNSICINTNGNPGMATGGMGDILTGIIGSLLATLKENFIEDICFRAASLGVYIHGMAGDIAAEKYSQVSLTASNVLECIPEVFKSIK